MANPDFRPHHAKELRDLRRAFALAFAAWSLVLAFAAYQFSVLKLDPRALSDIGTSVFAIWLTGSLAVILTYHLTARRVRQRHTVENRLQEREQLFRLLNENSMHWLFWRTPDGHYRYTSPACELITGYRPEDFAADPGLFERVIHEDDRVLYTAHLEASAYCSQSSAPTVFRIVTKDGRQRLIEHGCRAILDDHGHLLGVRGVNSDITQEKESERILITQSRHAAMGEMIGNIAHQWRQPISAIGLILQNIKYDFDDGSLDAAQLQGHVARAGADSADVDHH